jgi:hypothetical protein
MTLSPTRKVAGGKCIFFGSQTILDQQGRRIVINCQTKRAGQHVSSRWLAAIV